MFEICSRYCDNQTSPLFYHLPVLIQFYSKMGMAIREAALDLISFINSSPSPYHAVAEAVKQLSSAGFKRLDESADWQLSPGEHCTIYLILHEFY